MITIYYDSQCPLCCRYRQALNLLAKDQLEWIDIYTQPEANQAELLSVIHIKLSDGSILRGPEAMETIIKAIPGAERFSWLIDSNSAQKALNIFHETSDRLRRRLMKSCSSCHNKRSSL